jgi:hypothetical protein
MYSLFLVWQIVKGHEVHFKKSDHILEQYTNPVISELLKHMLAQHLLIYTPD